MELRYVHDATLEQIAPTTETTTSAVGQLSTIDRPVSGSRPSLSAGPIASHAQHIIDVHRHLKITDEQLERFVALYVEALDEAGLPDDEPFREAVRTHVEFG